VNGRSFVGSFVFGGIFEIVCKFLAIWLCLHFRAGKAAFSV
jgi:hypothetical protein